MDMEITTLTIHTMRMCLTDWTMAHTTIIKIILGIMDTWEDTKAMVEMHMDTEISMDSIVTATTKRQCTDMITNMLSHLHPIRLTIRNITQMRPWMTVQSIEHTTWIDQTTLGTIHMHRLLLGHFQTHTMEWTMDMVTTQVMDMEQGTAMETHTVVTMGPMTSLTTHGCHNTTQSTVTMVIMAVLMVAHTEALMDTHMETHMAMGMEETTCTTLMALLTN